MPWTAEYRASMTNGEGKYVFYSCSSRRRPVPMHGIAARECVLTLESTHLRAAITTHLGVLIPMLSEYGDGVDAHIVTIDKDGVQDVAGNAYKKETVWEVPTRSIVRWETWKSDLQSRFFAYYVYLREGWAMYWQNGERSRNFDKWFANIRNPKLLHSHECDVSKMRADELHRRQAQYEAGYAWFCQEESTQCVQTYIGRNTHARVQVHDTLTLFKLVRLDMYASAMVELFCQWVSERKVQEPLKSLDGFTTAEPYNLQDARNALLHMSQKRTFYGEFATFVAFILRNALDGWFPEKRVDGWIHDSRVYPFELITTDEIDDSNVVEVLLWNFRLRGEYRYLSNSGSLNEFPDDMRKICARKIDQLS